MSYVEVLRKRRSYYNLSANVQLTNEELKTLIGEILQLTPSAFNMQSAKGVLLLDEASQQFWKKVNETFDHSIDEEKQKGFEGAKGTVLYFIDEDTVGELQQKFQKYAQKFAQWAEHEAGMAQIGVWNALREQNIGASLQHYNDAINSWVEKDYSIPRSWKLVAQMPFGKIEEEPEEKEKLPLEERIKVVE